MDRLVEQRTPSRILLGLLAFSDRPHLPPPASVAQQGAELDVSPAIQKAQSVWRTALRNNHGLKEENVLRLFMPLGIGATKIDATLLSDLSSFGAARGEVAHTSASKVKRYIDPETEFKAAKQLVTSLALLDTLVQEARAELSMLDAAMRATGVVPQGPKQP